MPAAAAAAAPAPPLPIGPPAPAPAPSSASEGNASAASGPKRKVGAAAAEAKWSGYDAPAGAAPSRRHVRHAPATVADTLATAVRTTAPLRLLVAALLALLLSVAWDVQATKAAAPAGPWSQLRASWQQLLAARLAAPPLAAAASPMVRAVALVRRLPAAAYARAAATVESPLLAAALPQLQRIPPLATLALLSASLLGAGYVAVTASGQAARPATLAGPLARLARQVAPGLAARLSLLGAVHAALAGLADDVAMYLFVLVLYRVLPQAASGLGEWQAGA